MGIPSAKRVRRVEVAGLSADDETVGDLVQTWAASDPMTAELARVRLEDEGSTS